MWAQETLESYRSKTDPVADAVVTKIIESGETTDVNHLFRKMVENTTLPLDEMPTYVREYFLETEKLPDFADPDLIRAGEDVFATYGPEISMMLLCKSLPASYACGYGAEVLYRTGRLSERDGSLQPFTRRLMETSQFVINVMCKGGTSPTGTGIRTTQKVRLMHAAIRYFLHEAGDWDTATLGKPINQEDMAGTLMDFAVYPIEGLEQIGIALTPDEKEAYYHVWRLIGTVMGVEPELIPDTYQGGSTLGHAILNHQKRESEAGRVLTKACIDFLEHITPGTAFDFYPQILVRYLLGDEVADIIGIKKFPDRFERLLQNMTIAIFGRVDKVMNRDGLIAKLAKAFNTKLLEGMINYFNHDKQINFYIPPSLQEDWFAPKQKEYWDDVWTSPAILNRRVALQKKNKR
ncbi:MAG: DUF2236 domain-containing protein [Bernardetiaceae bacterium]|nr:DUF2236 domain-containing protein [Bernardetiaceae bacterium]